MASAGQFSGLNRCSQTANVTTIASRSDILECVFISDSPIGLQQRVAQACPCPALSHSVFNADFNLCHLRFSLASARWLAGSARATIMKLGRAVVRRCASTDIS